MYQSRMGLGWACLHVDLAVYTEEKRFTEHKRVTGHIQWTDFWGCYQFYGTGKRDTLVGGDNQPPRNCIGVEEASNVAHPLASWLLKKVTSRVNTSLLHWIKVGIITLSSFALAAETDLTTNGCTTTMQCL